MGLWRIEQDVLGPVERWVPDFPGEWPGGGNGFATPCPTCGGDLYRRLIHPNREAIRQRAERRKKVLELAASTATEPPPEEDAIEDRVYYDYETRCYRGPHGWTGQRDVARAPRQPTPIAQLQLGPAKWVNDD